MEIEPQQEGSFTPKSFQIRKARQGKSPRSPMATMMGAPPSSVVAGGQKTTAQQPVKPDPLQWLARSLSFYEGEWDKSAATETPTVRSKKLEHVLDDLIGTDEKLLTLKGSSIFDELETLIDEMWKNNEQALVQQTIRSTIGRHSGKLPGQYATMTAGKLRGTVIDTLAKKKQKDRRAVSVEDLWSRDIPATGTLVINPDIASKMLEKLNKSDEEGEDD
jgi:hypothetical protein